MDSRHERLARLARSLTGRLCDARKVFLFETRLKPVMDILGVTSVDALLDRIGHDVPSNLASYIADALTDGETWFFRERDRLEALVAAIAARSGTGVPPRPVSVWCAGGSTGQEAVSLAILLDERLAAAGSDAAVRIVTSDIGYRATTRARACSFSHFEIQRGLSSARMLRYFKRAEERSWQVVDTLRARIEVRQHNLLDGPLKEGAFDYIVCRNLLSELTEDSLDTVASNLKASLRPQGRLLTACSERMPARTGFVADAALGPAFYRIADPHPAQSA